MSEHLAIVVLLEPWAEHGPRCVVFWNPSDREIQPPQDRITPAEPPFSFSREYAFLDSKFPHVYGSSGSSSKTALHPVTVFNCKVYLDPSQGQFSRVPSTIRVRVRDAPLSTISKHAARSGRRHLRYCSVLRTYPSRSVPTRALLT